MHMFHFLMVIICMWLLVSQLMLFPRFWLCYDQQALGVQFHVPYGMCREVSIVFIVSVLIGIRDTTSFVVKV